MVVSHYMQLPNSFSFLCLGVATIFLVEGLLDEQLDLPLVVVPHDISLASQLVQVLLAGRRRAGSRFAVDTQVVEASVLLASRLFTQFALLLKLSLEVPVGRQLVNTEHEVKDLSELTERLHIFGVLQRAILAEGWAAARDSEDADVVLFFVNVTVDVLRKRVGIERRVVGNNTTIDIQICDVVASHDLLRMEATGNSSRRS